MKTIKKVINSKILPGVLSSMFVLPIAGCNKKNDEVVSDYSKEERVAVSNLLKNNQNYYINRSEDKYKFYLNNELHILLNVRYKDMVYKNAVVNVSSGNVLYADSENSSKFIGVGNIENSKEEFFIMYSSLTNNHHYVRSTGQIVNKKGRIKQIIAINNEIYAVLVESYYIPYAVCKYEEKIVNLDQELIIVQGEENCYYTLEANGDIFMTDLNKLKLTTSNELKELEKERIGNVALITKDNNYQNIYKKTD